MLNFNAVSGVYDFLARVVFGTTLERAKISQLGVIKDGQSVLYVGGGTGATLAYLSANFKQLKIDYVDLSSRMIRKAKQRQVDNLTVVFHNMPIEAFEGKGYDVIITEFFFDLFNTEQIQAFVGHLSDKMIPGGIWIDTDFREPQMVGQKILLRIVYLFFQLTARLGVHKLHAPDEIFRNLNWQSKYEIRFRKGFVTSRLLVRNGVP